MAKYRWLIGSIGMMLGASGQAADTQAKPIPPAKLCIDRQCDFATLQARSAAEFADSIGVNVHFHQSSTAYVTRYELIKQKLIESGIKHLRDGARDVNGAFPVTDRAARLFRDLGQSGFRFTFIFNPNVMKEFVEGYPAHVAPAFEAYEYPNELNARTGIDWRATLLSWGPTFHFYIRSNPTTVEYPIVGPSLVDMSDPTRIPDLSQYIDFGNVHAYYISQPPETEGWGARGTVAPCTTSRYGSLKYNLCNARRVAGSKPIMVTETGWGTDATTKNPVPEALQAKYLARMLLNHFDAGIPRTHIYQFIDSGNDGFQSFGLLAADGREKPAFHTVKALLSLLQDTSAVTSPGTLEFTLSGNIANVRKSVFQKSDGSFRAILWIDKAGFDTGAKRALAVPARNIVMRLGSSLRVMSATAFLDTGNTRSSTPTPLTAGVYSLQVTDHLLVLDVGR